MELSEKLGPKGLIKRTEFVRVIIQSLYSLGYEGTASLLESESGIAYKSPEYISLRSQILDSRWEDCIRTLDPIGDLVDETRASASYLIFRQCLLEFLNSGDDSSALQVLRKHISPLGIDKEKVHKLAFDIVSLGEIGLGQKEERFIGQLRNELLVELEGLLPPRIVMPQRRLEHLVETAVTVQIDSCIYHNSSDKISIYEDHCCGPDQIPTTTVQALTNHENEVWFVQFSNNGKYLASSSSDCTAIIWMVSEEGTVSLKHTLCGHKNPVSFVSWSPDDTMLLTLGNLGVLKLWDVEKGTCKHTFGEPGPIISSCAWFPDSERLVCSSHSPKNCIYTWDLKGNELSALCGDRIPKISDLYVTSDGELLISICSDKDIRVYNFKTKTEWTISEEYLITSLSISRDGQLLIVNLSSQEIHMWDVAGTWKTPLKYTGHKKQGKYVIRSCFGGSNCAFIASGSENSQIHIWDRRSCMLIAVLPGHSSAVNCVSWNPTNPQMLASASNDHTIRIWGPSGGKLESACTRTEC